MGHLSLERFDLRCEERELLLVRLQVLVDLRNLVLDRLRRRLGIERTLLKLFDFVPKRADFLQNECVLDLRIDPLYEWTASLGSTIDTLIAEVLLGQELVLDLQREIAGHLSLVVVVDDAGNEVVALHDCLD